MICIKAEDRLTAAAARRLLRGLTDTPAESIGRGFGDVLRQKTEIVRAARSVPFFVLLDGDVLGRRCAGEWIADNFGRSLPPKLVVGLAMLEVESWLMADREAFARFLGISESRLSTEPDTLPEPKEALLTLVRKSRRRTLRDAMLPRQRSTAQVGPEYNDRLRQFIDDDWRPEVAAGVSPSLRRAIAAARRLIEMDE